MGNQQLIIADVILGKTVKLESEFIKHKIKKETGDAYLLNNEEKIFVTNEN
jgi:hypothetical protein